MPLMPLPSRLTLISLIGSLMMLAALATDVMLAAFPTMAQDLGVSDAAIQQVLSIFLLGYALPHLVLGSLADRFGRRPVLLTGLVIYGLGSVVCLLAPTFAWLLLGRFVQGMGAAAGPLLARAILRDLFQGTELGRMMSFVMVFFAVGPILAPSLGAIILVFGDWNHIFIFLVLVAVLLLVWVAQALPETAPERDVHALDGRKIVRNTRLIFSHPLSGPMVLILSLAYAALIGYLASAPFIFITYYGVSEGMFALLFACVAGMSLITQPLNAWLLTRFSAFQILAVMLSLFVVVSALMVLQIALGVASLASLTVNLAAFFACFSLILANGTALALEPHRERAGIASGLIGFSQLTVGALVGTFIGSFAEQGPLPLAISIAVIACGTWLVFQWTRARALPAESLDTTSPANP